jgi:transposase InsO family protein
MSTYGSILLGAGRLKRLSAELSHQARQRLKWLDYYEAHGRNAALTCRHFGISRQSFYRWRRRYDRWDLSTVEGRSRRPKRLRRPTWSTELSQGVLKLREQYPRWGKDKLVVVLRREGVEVSTSMVGRILTDLKRRGVLREPKPNFISVRKWRRVRPYGVRKPKDYKIKEPGDLVEVDTLDVRPLPGSVLKHFTARDLVSRWDVLEAHGSATARNAATFLDALKERMPFVVKAIQVDGGSEFEAAFEEECKKRSIRLFVLPPRSPKLNGSVERAQRTHTEEFYEVTEFSLKLTALNRELQEWETVYNTIRPHQALGYLTPAEFLRKWRSEKKGYT